MFHVYKSVKFILSQREGVVHEAGKTGKTWLKKIEDVNLCGWYFIMYDMSTGCLVIV